MKWFKLVIIAVLGVAIPFLLFIGSKATNDYTALANAALFAYPIYLPVFCGFFGKFALDKTGKILLPIALFDLFLLANTYLLIKILFNTQEQNLSDSMVIVLLAGPLIYSIPTPFAVANFYKSKKEINK